MKSPKIKKLENLPAWFNLKKYQSAQNLDAAGWLEQLSVRQNLICLKTGFPNDEHVSAFQSAVLEEFFKAPIVDLVSNERMYITFSGGRLWALNNYFRKYLLGVHQLTVRELLNLEGNVDANKLEYALNWKAKVDEPLDLFGEARSHNYPYQDWIDEPVDNIANGISHELTIRVNLHVPDKILIDQFKTFLLAKRRLSQVVGVDIEAKLKPDYEGWVRFGVLPYLDLNIWAKLIGCNIPNRVMADAIFPTGEGGEEVVRKTTKKIADDILKDSQLDLLASLAANELRNKTD